MPGDEGWGGGGGKTRDGQISVTVKICKARDSHIRDGYVTTT